MKYNTGAAIVLMACALAGCRHEVNTLPSQFVEASSERAGNLEVTISLKARLFTVGDTAEVYVRARNLGKTPIDINATTGTPVYLRLWRNTSLGWEQVKRFPQSELMVMRPWRLDGKTERSFRMALAVAPDWPTAEPLRLTAEWNGRGDVRPVIIIEVLRRVREASEAFQP